MFGPSNSKKLLFIILPCLWYYRPYWSSVLSMDSNNVSAVFLHSHVRPHTYIHMPVCVDGHGCAGRLQKRCVLYTYIVAWYIWEYTLSYESVSINLHYFPFFYIILPCDFKVTLLFLLVFLSPFVSHFSLSFWDHLKEEVEEVICFLPCENIDE